MGSWLLIMTGLRLGVLCLLFGGVISRTMNHKEREELNQQYWRTVLDIFRTDQSQDEQEAREFLSYYNDEKLRFLNEETIAFWKYTTNITDHNDLLSQRQTFLLHGLILVTLLMILGGNLRMSGQNR